MTVGGRDDSFLGGGWASGGNGCDIDHVDGDYLRLIVQAGGTTGYMEKTGISVDAAVYPYLALGLWGDGDYEVKVYDGIWKTAQAMGDAPDTYGFKVIDLSGVTTGTVTAIRLGVGSAAGKVVTYDFFEFMSKPPVFPDDLSSLRVLQREGEADIFEMETVMNGLVGDDCVLLLHMDEGLGDTAFDDSEYGNDGDISGASWVDGKYGKALSFDGTDDVVDIGDHTSLKPSLITVEGWVKLKSGGNNHFDSTPLSKGWTVFACGFDNWVPPRMVFHIKFVGEMWTSLASTETFSLDAWLHVAYVYDGSHMKIYVNGVEKASLVKSGTIDWSTASVQLGSNNFGGRDFSIIDEVRIYNRALSAPEIKRSYQRGPPSRVYIESRHIRIVAGRGTNVEKIFAGVVEESTPKHGIRSVSGRCFQVKLQAATKTKSFDDRELSLAVKDAVEDFTKITTGRVETPSPAINIRKDYVDAHIADILDQMASLPSKQSPYEVWRWKLGYGQDLRFRSEEDSDVRTCATQIQEGTNLLVGVKKGSDLYELFNKVKALSGLVENPLDDGWCEATTDWSTDADCSIYTSSAAGYIRRGTVSLRIAVTGDPTDFWAEKSIAETDYTEYKRAVIDFWTGNNFVGTTYLELRFYSAGGGFFRYDLIGPNENRPDKTWWHFEIDLDDPNWQTSGSPSWTDINKVRIMGILGKAWSGDIYFDGLHFEADNLERVASDGSSPVEGDRVFVYKDAKIYQIDKLQDFADGLLQMVKAAADRILLPVVGAPDLQRGRKVTATSPSFGLSGDYIVAEAEHILSREVGYETVVLLDRGRYSLPADLKRTLDRELRREKLGTVTIL